MVGMVLPDTWLFQGTIAQNIAYRKMNATREEIAQAAKAARCDHFIRTLENGYDTVSCLLEIRSMRICTTANLLMNQQ